DNQLGKVVGEPTGNAPSSFGDILTFALPQSSLSFTLSFKNWHRPAPARDPAATLTPDVPVPLTRQDVLDRRDPVIEYLQRRRGTGPHVRRATVLPVRSPFPSPAAPPPCWPPCRSKPCASTFPACLWRCWSPPPPRPRSGIPAPASGARPRPPTC